MGHEFFGMKEVLGIALLVAVWIGHTVRGRLRERKLEEGIKQAGGDKC